MISVLPDVVQFVTAIVASVFQNVSQDAINAIVLPAFAAQHYAIIHAAAYAYALLANAILEEDVSHLVTMFAIMIVKYSKLPFYNIVFFGLI